MAKTLAALRSLDHNTPMGYSIFRIAKRKTQRSAAAMSKHALREVEVPNAVEGAPRPEVLAGSRTTPDLLVQLRAGIAQAKALGGPQGFTTASVQVLDMLVTTSRADAARMTKAEMDAYFRLALEFIAAKFGGMANILTAVIHRDETTPHMQVLVMPLDHQTNRFCSSKMIGGPGGLSKMQDAFWENCGRPFNLARGEKGSKAKHIPVRTFYAHAAGLLPDKEIELEQVPPAPESTWKSRLSGEYQAAKAKREEIIKRNNEKATTLINQSRQLRSLHPEILSRQADKYREAVRLEKLSSENLKKIDGEKKEVKQLITESKTHLKQIDAAIEHTQTQAYIREYDQYSKKAGAFYVARLAKQLGIDLVPGKGLIDQARRGLGITGAGASLLALQRLDEAAEAAGCMPIGRQMGDQQEQADDWQPQG